MTPDDRHIIIGDSGQLLPGTPLGQVPMIFREAGEKATRSEEHTSELQSRLHLVCRLLLEKKNAADLPDPDDDDDALGREKFVEFLADRLVLPAHSFIVAGKASRPPTEVEFGQIDAVLRT